MVNGDIVACTLPKLLSLRKRMPVSPNMGDNPRPGSLHLENPANIHTPMLSLPTSDRVTAHPKN